MAEEFTGPVDIDGTPAEPGVLSLDTPIGWGSGVGRESEMPCRGGRMRFLEDLIRPRRRASRRCNYLTLDR
jgi:hypothetical protein